MMYEAYERKVRGYLPLARTIKICVKCAILLLIISAVALLGYLALRGITFGEYTLQSSTVAFGDKPTYDCFVLFGTYQCEYARPGSEEWMQQQPTTPGEYRVRAVITKGFLGKKVYSEEGSVVLYRREVSLYPEGKVGAKVPYGEAPVFGKHWQISDDLLAKGHSVDTASLSYYTYDGKGGAICHIDPSSVVIRDRDGNDVTAGYSLGEHQGTIEVKAKKITVVVSDELKNGRPVNIEKIYDGKSGGTDRYHLTKGELLAGDQIVITTRGIPSDVGRHENSASISVVNREGQDRSAYYDVKLSVCKVVIEKRPLTVSTPDATLEYSGQTQYTDAYEIVDGTLVSGQTASPVHNAKTGVSEVTKRAQDNVVQLQIMSDGRDVTGNYNITYQYGSLTVKPRVLRVRTQDSMGLVYNGQEQSWTAYTVEQGSLGTGHTLSVKKAAQQTVPGSCENRVDYEILDARGQKVTDNYDLTVDYGTLTVEKGAQVRFSLLNLSKTYDASALDPADYQAKDLVSVSGGVLFADDYVEIVKTYGSQTDAGSSTYRIEYRIMHKESLGKVVDATSWYVSGVENEGMLTVHKRTVTVQFDPVTKKYDGKAVTPQAPDLSDASLARFEGKGHKIVMQAGTLQSLHYTKQGQYVTEAVSIGTYSYTVPEGAFSVVLNDGSGADRTHNYEIQITGNTIKIEGVSLKLTAPGGSKPYDGTPLSAESFSASDVTESWGISGYHATYSLSGSQTDAGSGSLQIQNVAVWDKNGNNVTENFEITTVAGKLTVTPIAITVKSSGGSKVYDGQPLENATQMTLVSGKLIAGHVLGGSVKSDYVTDVGTHKNTGVTPKVYSETGRDVTKNYQITLNPGEYTITPASLHIGTPLVEGEYSGKPYSGTCDATASAQGLASGHKVELNVVSDGVELGSHPMTVHGYRIVDARGRDVTFNYITTFTDGTIHIVPRRITVITGTSSVSYEQAPAVSTELRTAGSGLLEGHTIQASFTYPSGIFEIGRVTNSLDDIRIVNQKGRDVSAYYQVTTNYGTLQVRPIEMTLTTESAHKDVYDGQPIAANGYEITRGYLLEGHRISVTFRYENGIGDVGRWKNELTDIRIKDRAGNDVSYMYNVTIKAGTLEIAKPYELPMQSFDAEKVYDGTALANEEYVLLGELLPGHTVGGVKSVTLEMVGEQENRLTLVILDQNGIDVGKNYDFTYTPETLGTLTITHRPMQITLGHADVTYNGTNKLSIPQGQMQYEGLVQGQRFTLPVLVSSPEIGEKAEFSLDGVRVYDVRGREVTHCYYITVDAEQLSVTVIPAELTLYLPTRYSKEYDGTGIDVETVGYRPMGLAAGHSVVYEAKQAPAEPGDYTLEFLSWTVLDANGNDVTANYQVTPNTCAANIYPIYVKLTSQSASRHYTGQPLIAHQLKKYTLPDGYTLEVVFTGEQTAIGKSENTFDVTVYNASGEDVTAYCNVVKNFGTLEVWGERKLTLTSGSAKMIYNGSALICHELADYELPDGYTLEVLFTGSRTQPGESRNTFDVVIYDPEGNDATPGFVITKEYGTLTVLKSAADWVITLTSKSASKNYDGKALTLYELEAYELPEGFELDVVFTGSQTEIGVSANTFTARAYNSLGQELTVVYEYGTLEVSLNITVNAYEKTYTYDGTEKNCANDEFWVQGLPEGYRVEVKYGKGLTVTGSKNVEFESVTVYDDHGNDVTDQCNLTLNTANLTVQPRTLTVYVYGQSADSIAPSQGSLVTGHTMFAEYGENGECYIEITDQNGTLVYSNRGDSPIRYVLYDVIVQYG